MREQHEYLIEILQRDYQGVVDTLYPTGDVLVITQGSLDADEFTPIKSSEATLSLLCIEQGDPYISLFTTDAQLYKLRVRRKTYFPLEYYLPEWEGYLTAGTYLQEYRNAPYRVSLNATDGIALLKDIPFLDANGERYRGQRKLTDIFWDILARISDVEIVYNVDDIIIFPEQESSSMGDIGLECQSLYASFGEDNGSEPSCYEVLTSILSTFHLQLFQGYGSWHIRSVASLVSKSVVERTSPYVNNGGRVIPIYSDSGDDTGVSSSATLSLYAPYKTMKVSRPTLQNREDSVNDTMALNPSSWVPCFGTTKAYFYQFRDRMRCYTTIAQTKNTLYIGVAYLPTATFMRSTSMSLSMSFRVGCLNTRNKTIRVGFIAYRASDNIYDGLFLNSDRVLESDIPIWYWCPGGEDGEWRHMSAGDVYQWSEARLADMWTSVELPAATKNISLRQPVPASYINLQEVSLTADNLDIDTTESLRVAMIFRGTADDYDKQGSLPSVEFRDPVMNFVSTAEPVEDLAFDSAEVAKYGLGEVAYTQHYADAWVMPVPGMEYLAPLLKVFSGDMLRGLIVPLQRPLLADGVLSNIRALRGQVARQLEGEVYAKTQLDLNARWIDRDGGTYYTNYIRRHLRRGLYTVQLREIPRKLNDLYIMSSDVGNFIGLDTSVYFTYDNGLAVGRLDILSGKVSPVQDISHDRGWLTLNSGQRCVSVTSDDMLDDVTTDYSLRAYDTEGRILSTIDNVTELLQSVPEGRIDKDGIRSLSKGALYDANIGVWTLIGNVRGFTHIVLLNSMGEILEYKYYGGEVASGYLDHILMPNGFVFRSRVQDTVSNFWHSNSEQKGAEVERVLLPMSRVLAVNENFIAFVENGSIKVCRRNSLRFDFEYSPLVELNELVYTFVAMNNALVVVKTSTMIEVYDARTGRITRFPCEDDVWLSGDTVYTVAFEVQRSRITSHQIHLGDGVRYATYITSDDMVYKTINGDNYLVRD